MSTAEAWVIVACILLVGFLFLILSLKLAQKFMDKEVSFSSLLINFNQKIGMTFGLGITFFIFYLLIVYSISRFNVSSGRLNIFYFAYQNSIKSVYIGVGFFACMSILIYLVRIAIKRWYNKR